MSSIHFSGVPANLQHLAKSTTSSPEPSPQPAVDPVKFQGAPSRLTAGFLAGSFVIAGLGGCSAFADSETEYTTPTVVTYVDDQVEKKAEVDNDNTVFDSNTKDILGHFQGNGQAWIGDRLFYETHDDGKIYALVDPNDTKKAIHIANIKDVEEDGKHWGVLTGLPDNAVLGKVPLDALTLKEGGALAALTILATKSNAAVAAAQEAGIDPDDDDEVHSHAGSNFLLYYLLMRNSMLNQRAYAAQHYGSLDAYRAYSRNYMDPVVRDANPRYKGTTRGTLTPTGTTSVRFSDGSHISSKGGFGNHGVGKGGGAGG